MYENNRDYLIMELLTGEVMSDLRNRIRAVMPTGLVPVHIASYLARQMLVSIQKLHENHFIHRDVKPSNFVRKNINTTEFVMIDFGLAKLVSSI
jgi:serine/threonine protein kinase